MSIPAELLYTDNHEWVRIEEGEAVVGITEFAQGELGDIVFLELPGVGDQVKVGAECGTIEAVKTVAQLFAPVSGTISAINSELESDAGAVNRDPYGDGWFMKIKMSSPGERNGLLTPDAYRSMVN
jgi:glycine cleavage system H protein